MATNSIDKALAGAVPALDDMDPLAPGVDGAEIEVELPAEDPDGSVEILIGVETQSPDAFDANLAEYMEEGALAQVAQDLLADFDGDIAAREDWIRTYVDGLELLGLKLEDRAEPWVGACGIYHPLLAEAVVKFQSETMMEMFPASGPVKTVIIGKETPEKKEAAARVCADMNYQLTEVMVEYRPETERMLWGLGLAGNAFKKVYYDPTLGRQIALYVPAEDVVVPYGASDLQSSPRVTHVMRKTENEVRRLQVAGFYRDVDLGEPQSVLDEVESKIAERLGFRATQDDRFKLLEMHVDLDLPGHEDPDGIALPYVVTIEKNSAAVLAIRRNWDPDDPLRRKRQHFVHYGYVPGFGFYCFGLVHLIGAYAKSGTSLIRQLVDAGTLANLPGGFKTRGMRIKGDDTPIAPGEWRDVDVPSGPLRDNIVPLPYKEPSQTLIGLFDKIIAAGERFANTADLKLSDMSAQAPVGTTLAILERTLKVMSAVQARVHYSLRQELKLLKGIIAAYAPPDYNYEPSEGSRFARRSDYSDVDVIPVSDPNASTMAQKIVQYQAVQQLAATAPQLYNLPLLHRQMLEALGVKDAAKLVPLPEDMTPKDPVTENQDALRGKPLKAFSYQDHQAHIAVHQSALQDPQVANMLQQTPQGQAIAAALQAHINEHIGYAYRAEIEKRLGFNLPPEADAEGEPTQLAPEEEARLSPLLATAAQELLAMHQAQAAQQKAMQEAQDPLTQLQREELRIKEQEVQRKAAKDRADAELEAKRLQLEALKAGAQLGAQGAREAQRLAQDKEAGVEARKLDALKSGVKAVMDLTAGARTPPPPAPQGDKPEPKE